MSIDPDDKWYDNFVPPSLAQVFEPTEEEFKDPLTYIAKIRPVAECYGVVKIKPPPSWQPPFAIDIDNFKFCPRIQKLNELEGRSRIRLNFNDSIIKFWSLQGTQLRAPYVEGRPVDLYALHKAVKEAGGFEACCMQKKWSGIARDMQFRSSSGGAMLRNNYEKLLLPYDLYCSGDALSHATNKSSAQNTPCSSPQKERRMRSEASSSLSCSSAEHEVAAGDEGAKPPSGVRRGRSATATGAAAEDLTNFPVLSPGKQGSKELRRLQFYGAGPKLAGMPEFLSDARADIKEALARGVKPEIVAKMAEASSIISDQKPAAALSPATSASSVIKSEDSTPVKTEVKQETPEIIIINIDDNSCSSLSSVETTAKCPEGPILRSRSPTSRMGSIASCSRPTSAAQVSPLASSGSLEGGEAGAKRKRPPPARMMAGGAPIHQAAKTSPAESHGINVDAVLCKVCDRGDKEDLLLLCDTCDESFHTFCLLPPLSSVPKGDWRCPKCITEEVNKPPEFFGFEEGKRTYSLHSFGEMADQFKTDHFNSPCHMVPCDEVEREFWRLVNNPDGNMRVEYGADLFTDTVGSGFPKMTDRNLLPVDEPYARSPWNLNNLPVLKNSILSQISTEISGMKIPWVYVGMVFSTFCWHTEDHWSYSVNYLHWGEPKTWYGCPAKTADKFEEAMKKICPDLFETTPDLLHHLVTIMNPRLLMDRGVEVYTVQQCAGEFVITFPRAYHTGFNQGYNFAEAVNFCPADWLPHGRRCLEHYSTVKRLPVFSHDEMVCKMAASAEALEISVAAVTFRDMQRMVEKEREQRRQLLQMGVKAATKVVFELLHDDERQCLVCRTTCFLSAFSCQCNPKKLVCLNHAKNLPCTCDIGQRVLKYRFTLDDLATLLNGLKTRSESFDQWNARIKTIFDAPNAPKPTLTQVKELVDEAKVMNMPPSETLESLTSVIKRADRCAMLADQLVANKIRTRNRQSGLGNHGAKLRLAEVEAFYVEITKLNCSIPQVDSIKEFIQRVHDFKAKAKQMLCQFANSTSAAELAPTAEQVKQLSELLDEAVAFDLQLEELPSIKDELGRRKWLLAVEAAVGQQKQNGSVKSEEVDETKSDIADGATTSHQISLDRLKELILAGINFPATLKVEEVLGRLQRYLVIAEAREDKASVFLRSETKASLELIEQILENKESVGVSTPYVSQLEGIAQRARIWFKQFHQAKVKDFHAFILGRFGSNFACSLPMDPKREPDSERFSLLENRFRLESTCGGYASLLSSLVSQGKALSSTVAFGHNFVDVTTTFAAADSLVQRLARLFLRDSSLCTLAEIMWPRTDLPALLGDVGLTNVLPCVKKQNELLDDSLYEQASNLSAMRNQLMQAEQLELQCIMKLRKLNRRKAFLQPSPQLTPSTSAADVAGALESSSGAAALSESPAVAVIESPRKSTSPTATNREYCLCQEACSSTDSMLKCLLCEDYFHVDCLMALDAGDAFQDVFLCPRCCRSRRPPTESIAPLEVGVRSLPIELKECVALKRLIERTQAWQMRVREFIKTPAIIDLSLRMFGQRSAASAGADVVPEISEETSDLLERLLCEGLLLETSTPEIKQILSLYSALHKTEKAQGRYLQLLSQIKQNRSLGKRRASANPDAPPLAPLRVGPPLHESSGQKGSARSSLSPIKVSSPEANGSGRRGSKRQQTAPAEQKSPPQRNANENKRRRAVKEVVEDDDSDDSDATQEPCAAPACLQPIGDEVHWVQCDGPCEDWFHILCVGLNPDAVGSMEKYYCFKCAEDNGCPSDLSKIPGYVASSSLFGGDFKKTSTAPPIRSAQGAGSGGTGASFRGHAETTRLERLAPARQGICL